MSEYWQTPRIWARETAYLVGGGPSIRRANLSQLIGKNIITINDSFQLLPWAEVLYFCDRKWWNTRCSKVSSTFLGRYLVTLENVISRIHRLKNTGQEGLEENPAGLRNGCNSGYQAINLAYHLGASRIVLLGYDMKVTNGESHWNVNRPEMETPGAYVSIFQYTMLPRFQTLVEPLERLGIEVINATPDSALTCWPYLPLEETL
jgi:hypothetical protein